MEYLLERVAKELESWERMGDNMTDRIDDLEDRVEELTREAQEWQEEAKMLARECDGLSRYCRELEQALLLAYRALTEGMADVPAEGRDPKCARLRAEAKREIRRVLGMGDEDAGAKWSAAMPDL